MNPLLRRITAIVALVLALIFTTALIAFLFDQTLLGGMLPNVLVYSGIFVLALYLVLRLSTPSVASQSADGDSQDEGAESDQPKGKSLID